MFIAVPHRIYKLPFNANTSALFLNSSSDCFRDATSLGRCKLAQITDARLKELADEIIAAQEREISEMKCLTADLKRRD